ncbi:UDP-N-acetylmuramoyl-tripeptide--D-alanyl-D-alanine ligase [Bacillus songklensis]|uniref:UDP-N-acetylmuramoyl-tripeptide--D-alanyl-D-alanine ligase n=1 Tax=Bacillus songklensis TaxID=1069116 RepID=A0ABV8B033_9BACI
MITRTIKEVQEMIPDSTLQGDTEVIIKGVSIDTRTIEEGNLFVPIKGEKFNGHEFVQKAIESGASATLWNRNEPNMPENIPVLLVEDTLTALQQLSKQYRDQLGVKVVGVTGSNGKTTTKDMIFSVLSTSYQVLKTEGNFNNHIGLPLTMLRLTEETEIAILEMGMSSRGEIELLSQLAAPHVAVITNIGESHLLDLGSRDGIAEAKLEIISGLQEEGLLIYNGDEPLLTSRVEKMAIKTVTFGKTSDVDLHPLTIEQQKQSTLFTISQAPDVTYEIPVLGVHNVHNALAAIAVGRFFNIPFSTIAEGLNTLRLTNMRMEMIPSHKGFDIINDAYNASPTSMKAAISLLEDLKGYGQKFIVLGDMLELGAQEKSFHYEVGQIINPQKIDYVFTCGKLGLEIAKGAETTFEKGRVQHFGDKKQLVQHLAPLIQKGDVVLVKASRGMRLEEVVEALKA